MIGRTGITYNIIREGLAFQHVQSVPGTTTQNARPSWGPAGLTATVGLRWCRRQAPIPLKRVTYCGLMLVPRISLLRFPASSARVRAERQNYRLDTSNLR